MEFIEALADRLRLRPGSRPTGFIIRSNRQETADEADFSFGIEEEYFLADEHTFEVVRESPDALFDAASLQTGKLTTREFLQSQIEIGTNIHSSVADAREELRFLRHEVAKIAHQFGMTILASGTHPTAEWWAAVTAPKPRYIEMMDDLQIVGNRDMLCGMHVHVRIPDSERRIDLMTRLIPYLPLFLALSTSSPFWASHRTGLKGYRLAAYDELPRTGVPPLFRTNAALKRYVDGLIASGAMKDASYLWWMARPSHKHPTLELRATDCCTDLEDGIAIAALYRSLIRLLYTDRGLNANIDDVERAFAVENKWRAQRYGVEASFVSDHGPVPVSELLDEVIDRVAVHAMHLQCLDDVLGCKRIAASGTSSDRQLQVFEAQNATGAQNEALRAVCAWIARTTVPPGA
ncbi:MAG: carboxylate-amine ligase [Xanthobacteraceae bacterium]|nr:carboxylate-amine ligase [Xanthobacteraceae bacterium]